MNELQQHYQKMREALAQEDAAQTQPLVFGEGPETPRLLLIGEAPGERESLQGRPFVGKAGKNLDRFLELAELKREEIFITNTVKIRPTKVGKTGRVGNRPPTRAEIAWFRPWLLQEIELLHPRFVATLGNVPLQALIGEVSIGSCHGKPMPWQGRILFPLYHPASIIYRRALETVYEQDVRALAEIMRRA